MLSNEQVQKIGELTEAKHNAAVALRAAQEKYDATYHDLEEYLCSLTEPVKRARKRRSDAGRIRTNGLQPEAAFAKGLSVAQASLSGLPDENGAGN